MSKKLYSFQRMLLFLICSSSILSISHPSNAQNAYPQFRYVLAFEVGCNKVEVSQLKHEILNQATISSIDANNIQEYYFLIDSKQAITPSNIKQWTSAGKTCPFKLIERSSKEGEKFRALHPLRKK